MTYGQRTRAAGKRLERSITKSETTIVATLELTVFEAMIVKKALEALAYSQDTLRAKSGDIVMRALHEKNLETCQRLAKAITQQERNPKL